MRNIPARDTPGSNRTRLGVGVGRSTGGEKAKRPGLRCWPKPARRPGRLLRGRSTTDRSSGVSLRLDQCHRPSELALRRAIRFSVGLAGYPARPSDRSSSLPGCPVRTLRTAQRLLPGCPARRPRTARCCFAGCPALQFRTSMPRRRRLASGCPVTRLLRLDHRCGFPVTRFVRSSASPLPP